MSEIRDIGDTTAPKSNQMNADDLTGRDLTLTITEVRIIDDEKQPCLIFFAEFPKGRPWKPNLGMRRHLMDVWGPRSAQYVGKRITLYREGTVTWAGDAIGGIRIRAMSGLREPKQLPLTVSQKKREMVTILPLPDTAPTSEPMDENSIATQALRAEWHKATPERKAEIEAEVKALTADQPSGESA